MINTEILTSGINFFLLVPIIGFAVSLLLPEKNEHALSMVAFITAGATLIAAVVFILLWGFVGFESLNLKEFLLYGDADYFFLIDFFFDKVTAVYLFVGSFLTFLITRYSRYYLHREKGYKRFFNTILFFYLGYNITIFAGNFETLFIGWEILGMSSFLLVAFYRERYLPVRNAVKVFSIYRIGDVGLLLAIWGSHHLWHENISFLKLNNYELVHEHLQGHSYVGIFISLMLLLAAAAKSAQFPFSSWLPRAMEGPTPSSAIFYGSLSVHFGVFLLLRTFPFWEDQHIVRILIGLLGLTSAIVASSIGRVQSSIKTQIAYASIAQIGLIFIEVALGLETLALIHFAGNAFLRTYQLLVSPSAVSYLISSQLYNYKPRSKPVEDSYPKKIEYAIFKLSMREYYLDELPSRLIFTPLKKIGHRLDFMTLKNSAFFFFPTYVIGLYFLWHKELVSTLIISVLPVMFGFFGLLLILKALGERKQPRLAFIFLIMNHLWVALAISFNEKINFEHLFIYLSGAIVTGILGYIVLSILRKKEPEYFTLNKYYGHGYEHPRLAFLFLLACLGVMGFPITSTFIGVDLVFSHIHADQFLLAFINSMSFVFGGIVAMRMYARLFLGPHVKSYHDVALKSS